MKNYTITVNGNVYDVTVENGSGAAPKRQAAPKGLKAAPMAQRRHHAAGAGSIQVKAGVSRQSIQVGSKRWTECKEGATQS